jgi:hypothetical protein
MKHLIKSIGFIFLCLVFVSSAMATPTKIKDKEKKSVKYICGLVPMFCIVNGKSNGGGSEPPKPKTFSNGGGSEPPKPNKKKR